MASETILDLARQGDPKVIAALINRLVKPKGILAKATKQDQCLHVLLESPHRLNQQATATLIQQLVEQCQVATINQLTIYARQAGSQAIDWKQDVDLHPTPISDSCVTDGSASDLGIDASLDATETVDLAAIATPTEANNNPVDDGVLPDLADDPACSDAPQPTTAMTEEPIPTPDAGTEADIEADIVSHASLVSDSGIPPATEPHLEEDEAKRITDLEIFHPDDNESQKWDVLKRPEAALLIVFALIVALWDIYLALIEEPDSTHPLTGRELARRLGVDSSTISRRKDRLDFSEWTQDLDPEGWAWVYHNGVYLPQPNAETLVDL